MVMKEITIKQLQEQKTGTIIDIREKFELKEGTYPQAKHIPMLRLLFKTATYLNKDETYYLICRSGSRSQMTCNKLNARGYDVVNVVGGMNTYEALVNKGD